MYIWFKFIIIPLMIFVFIFLFCFMILITMIGCGYDSSAIPSCIKTSKFLFALSFILAMWLGYITTKLAPIKYKYVLANIYHLFFSILIFFYLYISKVTTISTIGYNLLFFICTCLGCLIYKFKNNKNI